MTLREPSRVYDFASSSPSTKVEITPIRKDDDIPVKLKVHSVLLSGQMCKV